MLARLRISNFAIIKHLDISFKSALSILSGETGAGKSIIINAINLVLGGRASAELIRTGSNEARVEALFVFPTDCLLADTLRDLGIPFCGELLIKRTIFREGKNRITVNDSICTLQSLSRIGGRIISISGQHEHQLLLRPDNHLFLLDAFANLEQERRALEEIFNRYQLKQEQARALTEEISRAEEQQALRAFQMQEIERAAIVPGEDSLLVEEKKRLQHAEELQRIISEGYQTLYETEESILSVLSRCAKKIRRGAELDQRLSTIGEALEELEIKLEDVCLALRDAQGVMQPDPYRLDEILERIRVINQLKRKYGPSLEEVMAFKEELVLNHADLQERKDALKYMKKELDDMGSQLVRHAVSLSGKRKKSARALEADVEDELNQLHMPNTRFRLHFSGPDEEEDPNRPPPIRDIRADGLDRVEFLISPNVGEELRPLSKIASGGELSRIMLALKTILAKAGTVETLIFDEVDAGIGGATAEVVGEKLLALSRYHQILCISHLPQIASKGENHFLVKKTTQGGRSQTNIVDLGPEERVREIARLLGGKEITPKAVAHAKEMLGQGQ